MVDRSVSLILRCHGCAAVVDPGVAGTSPFRCPNVDRAPNIDHVLTWDPVSAGVHEWPTDASTNPYIRYRTLQHGYWQHRSRGATDADHVALVERLDRAIAQVAGVGFRVTPFRELDHVARALGVAEVWAKIDTGNVAGSHKARHLMGILLHLEAQRVSSRTALAIASCGNAAIAAATLAKASRRTVEVYVPTWVKPGIREHLRSLNATLHESPRQASDPPGDPCLHRFHDALKRGALPFCVQGIENALTIDGGATLGHELADQFAMLAMVPDRLFVQTGGGALGSSVARGLRDAFALGVIDRLPRFHFVQAEGCAPLERAWRAVAARALRSMGRDQVLESNDATIAAALSADDAAEPVAEALAYAATHRTQFMWAWEDPESIATGILDDETYDWLALVRVMIATGGWPVVSMERHFERALQLACPNPSVESCCGADFTGAASLAGAVALHEHGELRSDERIAALLTGHARA